MSDYLQNSVDASLESRIADLLSALGGQTACCARRLGGASSSITFRDTAPMPSASLAKLCIAVEVFRRLDLGQFDRDERFDLALVPAAGGGGVADYLAPATRLTIPEICHLMLAASDNTAGNLLLHLIGIGEVNETMHRLHLEGTVFSRRFMDWDARAAGWENVTTASDMVSLLALLNASALPGAKEIRRMLAGQLRADDIISWLPPHAELMCKTGSLDDVFHIAGLLHGPGGTVAISIMTAAQASIPDARTACGKVLRLIWDAWCDSQHTGQ